MNNALPPPRWLDQPQLIIHEDFDREERDVTTVGTAAVADVFQNDAPGWQNQAINASGTSTLVTGVTNHVGVWSFTTGATSGNTIAYGYTQGGAFGSGGFTTTNIIIHEKLVNIQNTTSVAQAFGLGGNWLTLAAQYVVMSHQTSVGANWLVQTQTTGGTPTTTDSGVAVTAGWHLLGFEHIFYPSELWNFYLDGVLIGTISTNLPAGLMAPGGRIVTLTAATRSFLIDDEKLWVHGSTRLAA